MTIYVVNLLRLYRHKLRLYLHFWPKLANFRQLWTDLRYKWAIIWLFRIFCGDNLNFNAECSEYESPDKPSLGLHRRF